MKALALFLICFGCLSRLVAADDPTELKVQGKIYTGVKVMKATAVEIKIMHADGFASVPLSKLPEEWQAKYGAGDPAAEEAKAEAARRANAEVYKRALKEKTELTKAEAQAARQRAADAASNAAPPSAVPANSGSISSRPAVASGRSNSDAERLLEREARRGSTRAAIQLDELRRQRARDERPAAGVPAAPSEPAAVVPLYRSGEVRTLREKVSTDPLILKLDNGSLWQVHSLSRFDALTWLAGDDLILLDGDMPGYMVRIVNKNGEGKVDAKMLSR